MEQKCIDIFEEYQLPFETYYADCISHGDEIHDEMELVWVLDGQATIICEDKVFEMTSNTVFMIYMNRTHQINSKKGSSIISFRFKKDYLIKNNLYFERIPYKNKVFSFEELADKYHEVPLIVNELVQLLCQENPSPSIRYKIIGYYNMYIYDLYHVRLKEKYMDIKKTNYDPYLLRINWIIKYIYDKYSKKISLNEIANELNISTFRLSHFIKSTLGVSFSTFLQHARFEHAIEMIKNTTLSIERIAMKCGFSDVKYLNQIMKQKFHITALKYRKIMCEKCDKKKEIMNVSNIISSLNKCIADIQCFVELT